MSDITISTVEYGTGGSRSLTMHLLRAQRNLPVAPPPLLWVHGGAFRHGSKESGIAKLVPFARRGYVCASVEYRLSGEATPARPDRGCQVRGPLSTGRTRANSGSTRNGSAPGEPRPEYLVAMLGSRPITRRSKGTAAGLGNRAASN
ncbi:MAG: hypothetical protein U0232_29580 [Thermomicrobiales bacterium]